MHLRWGTIKNSVTHPYFFPPFPDFINRNGKTNAVSLINTLFRTLLGVIKIGTGVLFAGGWTGEKQRGWWEPPSGGSGIKGNWSSLCFLFPPEMPGRREINSSPSLLPEPSLSPFSHILPLPCQRSLMVCASVPASRSLYPACWLQTPHVFIYHEADPGWMLLEKCPLFKMSLPLNRPCIILTGVLSEAPEWRGWMEGCHSSWLCCPGWVSESVSEWVSEWVTNTLPMTGDTTWRRSRLHLSEASR